MNITGIDKAMRDLQKLAEGAQRAQRAGEKRIADKIAAEAQVAAPGSLSAKINVTQTETKTTINGGDDFSAWVEFGTGENAALFLASQPPEVVEEARKFFVNGKGRGAAKPFFFPSVFRNIPNLIPAVEEELGKLLK